jgi:enamine deaminase RidA (YjgF/YER057c/UK114 family)
LHTSGVVPIGPDGAVPSDIGAQAETVWTNLRAILDEAGMVATDVVSITTYVVVDHLASLPTVMAARDRALGGHRAASTLVTVPALARPEWLMEIALVASS